MKNVKMKLLSLSISAATLMSSTSVFAASNVKSTNEKTQTTLTTSAKPSTVTSNVKSTGEKTQTTLTNSAKSQITKPSTITTRDYDHVYYDINSGYVEVHYNGWVATCNMYSDAVGYGYIQSGNQVRCAQLLLQMEGYSLTADAAFGTNTYNAVMQYQQSHYNLIEDGVVGESTWKSLLGIY